MRTAKARIENLEQLKLNINLLKIQCKKQEEEIKTHFVFIKKNKVKLLLAVLAPGANRASFQLLLKVATKALLPAIISKDFSPLTGILVKTAGTAVKEYAAKKVKKIFKRNEAPNHEHEIAADEDKNADETHWPESDGKVK